MEKSKNELWVINKDAQYRITNKNPNDTIEFSFWTEDNKVEKFKTSYKDLLTILKASNPKLVETQY